MIWGRGGGSTPRGAGCYVRTVSKFELFLKKSTLEFAHAVGWVSPCVLKLIFISLTGLGLETKPVWTGRWFPQVSFFSIRRFL